MSNIVSPFLMLQHLVLNMVYVAERLRRKFVALVYAGLNPVVHPNIKREYYGKSTW